MTVIEGIISRFVAGDNPGYPADTPASKKGLYYDQRTNMFICTYSDSVRVTVVSMLSFPRETARCNSIRNLLISFANLRVELVLNTDYKNPWDGSVTIMDRIGKWFSKLFVIWVCSRNEEGSCEYTKEDRVFQI